MKTLAVMVFAVGGSACGVIPIVEEPAVDSTAVVDLWSREQRIGDWVVEGREPAAGGIVAPRGPTGPITCVVVQHCDAPGPDGTRCVQKGCNVLDALTECSIEAPRECSRVVCPFVLVGPSGVRFRNGACF